MRTCWEPVENMLGPSWEPVGNPLGTCWKPVGNMSATCQEPIGNMSGSSREPVMLMVRRSVLELAPAESSPSAVCAALSFLIWLRCSWIHSGFEGSSCVHTTSVLLSRLYFYLIIMIKIINYFSSANYLLWCGISFASNCHEWTGRRLGNTRRAAERG